MPTIYVDTVVIIETVVPDTGMFFSAPGPDDGPHTGVLNFEDRNMEILFEDRDMVVGPRRIGYP